MSHFKGSFRLITLVLAVVLVFTAEHWSGLHPVSASSKRHPPAMTHSPLLNSNEL